MISGTSVGADLVQHLADRLDLRQRVRVRTVHHVQQQIRVRDLLQRRAERLDDVVRQVPDEPDGVGERVHPAVGRRRPAGGRVQGREQRVLDQDTGTGDLVQQRGLARVGVARDRDRRDRVPAALLAHRRPRALHVLQLAAQLGDLGVDPAPVGLDLGFTGTTATDTATGRADASTGLAGQVATPTTQPLLHVLQLGQLDLGLAFLALRVLGEDVQDQRGPVDHLDLELVLQVAQLRGGQLAVGDHRVGAERRDQVAQVGHLAGTDEGRRVRLLPPLDHAVQHLGTGGLGEQLQLGQRVLRVLGAALGPDADQQHPLEQQLAVLDLADVGQLGRHADDAAQRLAFLELEALGARLPGSARES